MKLKFISSLRNANFETNVNLDSLKICIDKTGLNEFIEFDFVTKVGLLALKVLEDNQFIYFNGDINELKIRNINKFDKEGIQNAISQLLLTIVNSLWFVKDNSITTFQTYFYYPEETLTAINSIPLKLTNSAGETQLTSFSIDELKQYIQLLPKVIQLNSNINNPNIDVDNIRNLAELPYKFNRIGRALIFLYAARKENILPARITSYIALLECLFTTGNSELTHQVSERVALFIGLNYEQRIDIYKKVRLSYNIRSRYMHGDTINTEINDLKNISKDIDEIIRQIFIKIINGETEIFLLSNSDGDKKKFETYYQNLIFK